MWWFRLFNFTATWVYTRVSAFLLRPGSGWLQGKPHTENQGFPCFDNQYARFGASKSRKWSPGRATRFTASCQRIKTSQSSLPAQMTTTLKTGLCIKLYIYIYKMYIHTPTCKVPQYLAHSPTQAPPRPRARVFMLLE